MKRFLTAALSLLMVLTLLPVKAAAYYPDEYNVHFVLADGTEVRTDYNVYYCYSVEAPAYGDVENWTCESLREDVSVGERFWPDGENADIYFVADEVVPDGFNIRYEDALGNELPKLGCSMSYTDMAFYMPFCPQRTVVDFGEDEGWQIADFWTADLIGGQLVMDPDTYVTGDTMTNDFSWYESYPTVTFVAGLEALPEENSTELAVPQEEQPLELPQLHTNAYPQTYTIHYELQDGTEVATETCDYVNAFTVDSYKGVSQWTCQELDSDCKTVKTGETVWGDSFGMNRDVTFVAEAVLPDTFTLNFMNGTRCIKSVTVAYDDYFGISLPRVILEGGLAAWCDGNVVLAPNDYVSGQTLDEDYCWYETNPVLVLNPIAAWAD